MTNPGFSKQCGAPSRLICLLILCLTLLLLPSCQDTGKSRQAETGQQSVERFDSGYQPPRFEEEDRASGILAVQEQIDDLFRAYAEANHYPGFVYGIVLDDSLIYSGATGVINLDSGQPVTTASLFHIASMTKSFTSMAILKLRDEGKLNLDDPVDKYIPEFAGQQYLTRDAPRVTVRNLMTMSSGFPEDNPWADRQLEETDEAFLAMIEDGLSFANAPNLEYEYSNLGYAMLGTIINNVTGSTYQEYITREILHPLGMHQTIWEYGEAPTDLLALGYRWEDEVWKAEPMLHSGAFGAIGGLITSLEDFSKYVSFHLSAWPPRNDPEEGPIRRSTLREMHRMTFPRLNPDAEDEHGEPCPIMVGYGYGLGITKNCHGMTRVAHSGGLPGYGSQYRFFPEYGLGIISFANRTYAGTGGVNGQVELLLRREGRLKGRSLPASPILQERADQVQAFLQSWDASQGEEFLAENFFLDQSLEHRRREMEQLLAEAGTIESAGPLQPVNNLRGQFTLHGSQKDIQVFFTLSPEQIPKVQAIYTWLTDLED